MRAILIIISTAFLFLGLFGTFGSSKVFASKESNSFAVNSESSSVSKSLSIKDLDRFTAQENLRFTIRNAGGILIPNKME